MTTCPLTKRECRHCSTEREVTVQRVGVIRTGAYETKRRTINLGARCNNDGRRMVSELTMCPADAALGVPLVQREVTELEWMKLR